MTAAVITMSNLGYMGQFGNQVFQYMFLRTYARRHGFQLQTPPWIGQALFGFDDPPIETGLPEFSELYDKYPNRMVIPNLIRPVSNVDLSGYFQYPGDYYVSDRDWIQELFTPVVPIKQSLDRGLAILREKGNTIISLHLRRGDYGYRYFYITPESWYLQWLEKNWSSFDRPVLYIATDDPSVIPAFNKFAPLVSDTLFEPIPDAPFYPDFYTMTQSDILVMPNSSFSFAASMLNQNLTAAYRSKLSSPLQNPPFEQVDPWQDVPLDVTAYAEDFPDIDGIRSAPIESQDDPPKPSLFRRWFGK